MLALSEQAIIHVAIAPVDFRKGLASLVAVCQQRLGYEPFSGHWFVFRNKQGSALKIIVYDGTGFWCCHKRFSKGKVRFWPTALADDTLLPASDVQRLLQQLQLDEPTLALA